MLSEQLCAPSLAKRGGRGVRDGGVGGEVLAAFISS